MNAAGMEYFPNSKKYIFERYKETSEKKIKAYTEENTKLQNELNEIKDKNANMEAEISRLKESNERLENEKKINEDFIEEKKDDEDRKETYYIKEIQNLQKQL